MNIFQWKPLDLELKILEILENIASLRPRSATMAASLEMFRHAIIIYSANCIHFRGLYATRTAARDPKSRKKVHFKSVLTDLAMCTGLTMGMILRSLPGRVGKRCRSRYSCRSSSPRKVSHTRLDPSACDVVSTVNRSSHIRELAP